MVQVGTTSKTLFPGLRLGWAAGPAEVIARLVSAKQNTDQCAGALGQRLFEESVRRGFMDEQLVRSRALYERKCGRMLAALERSMPGETRWTRPDGVLPETIEYPDHPWFIGVQYHPELKSRPFEPHPLFASFVEAAVVQSRLV